jgi:phosphoenolpyruvate carboxykinase (GTP)
MAATMGSETTAAAAGQMGVVRRDPYAMLPFIGYNMSDYFQHWLDLGRKVKPTRTRALPKIFCVNWFRTDESGNFVWPGYGDNMRVLKWILDRSQGQAAAASSTCSAPRRTYGDLNWTGIEFTEAQFTSIQITSIDKDAWREELKLHTELFDKLAYRLPQELVATKQQLEQLAQEMEAPITRAR